MEMLKYKYMKYRKIFTILIAFCLFLYLNHETVFSSNQQKREILIRKIEILKREVTLLQSLVLNFNSRLEISSPSYLVLDISNNSIFLEKNSNQKYPIASITKLMTSIIAFENIDYQKSIVLTEPMLQTWGHSPSLFLGSKISAENLIKASLIQSTNDASEALTFFSGKKFFLNAMNQKAQDLGMKDTIFYDAHGLSLLNQSTAQDLSILLNYIYKNYPEILKITKENNFWLPDKTGRMLKFQNLNNFYPLSYFIGGKTGYLPEAKQTMAAIFNINNKPFIIIALYSNNRQADIFSIIRKIKY